MKSYDNLVGLILAVIVTAKPTSAKAMATARPIPRLAPVIKATGGSAFEVTQGVREPTPLR